MPDNDLVVFSKNRYHSTPFRDLLDAFFRSGRTVAVCCLLFTAILSAYLIFAPVTFESELLLLVKNERGRVAVGSFESAGPNYPQEVSDTQIGTEIQLFQSKDLLTQVARKFYEDSKVSLTPADLTLKVKHLETHLTVSPMPKTDLIRLAYSADKAQDASRMLQILVDTYLDYHLRLHGATNAYQFFGQQADFHQAKLKAAQQGLAKFERDTSISVLPEQKDLNLRKLSELRAALDEAKTASLESEQREIRLKDEIGSAKPRIVTQQRTIPNQYSIDHLNSTLVDLRNKRTTLLTKFKPDSRLVQEVDKQIADTTAALESSRRATGTEEATDINPLRQTLEGELTKTQLNVSGLRAREQGLASQVRFYEQELNKLNQNTAEHEKLLGDVKESEENYALYNRKREEARISGALDNEKIANVRVAEGPTQGYSKPRFTLGVVCGYILGNLFLAGIIVIFSMRKPVIHAPWELELFQNIPVLATVPFDRTRVGFYKQLAD